MAAFSRAKYPFLVSGAISSSSPLKAKETFWEFDLAVKNGLPPDCRAAAAAAIAALDARVSEGHMVRPLARTILFNCKEKSASTKGYGRFIISTVKIRNPRTSAAASARPVANIISYASSVSQAKELQRFGCKDIPSSTELEKTAFIYSVVDAVSEAVQVSVSIYRCNSMLPASGCCSSQRAARSKKAHVLSGS